MLISPFLFPPSYLDLWVNVLLGEMGQNDRQLLVQPGIFCITMIYPCLLIVVTFESWSWEKDGDSFSAAKKKKRERERKKWYIMSLTIGSQCVTHSRVCSCVVLMFQLYIEIVLQVKIV